MHFPRKQALTLKLQLMLMLPCQLPCHLLIDKFAHVWALIFICLFDNGTNFMFEPMLCGSSNLKNIQSEFRHLKKFQRFFKCKFKPSSSNFKPFGFSYSNFFPIQKPLGLPDSKVRSNSMYTRHALQSSFVYHWKKWKPNRLWCGSCFKGQSVCWMLTHDVALWLDWVFPLV
jgi:hypothetical protein